MSFSSFTTGTLWAEDKAPQVNQAGRPLSAEAHLGEDPLLGWMREPSETVSADHSTLFEGKPSIRIERNDRSLGNFSSIARSVPMNFEGKKVELRARLRTVDVVGFAGLWAREDESGKVLEFDNMNSRHLSGTKDWTEYVVELKVNPTATVLFYGLLLSGTGKVWGTQPQLFLDGKLISPVQPVQPIEARKTTTILDEEFDNGSRLQIDTLSDQQLDNLVTLGEVWGFLKYFHPTITMGGRQWDYELFRVLPRILKVSTKDDANRVLVDWIASLGSLPVCSPCATEVPDAEVQLPSPTRWIRDKARLGERLSNALENIYKNRKPGTQFYVSLAPNVGNTIFENEAAYDHLVLPDSGFQLLAAYRFWAAVQYWYPYRDLIINSWESALRESIPNVTLARNNEEFDRALLILIAHVTDTHTNLWSSLTSRPPEGGCILPVTIRFIERHPTIADAAPANPAIVGLQRGDVIKKIEGTSVDDLVTRWLPYYAGSNDVVRMRDIARSMTHGSCGDVKLEIVREGSLIQVVGRRLSKRDVDYRDALSHDLPGEVFKMLPSEIAYLKLSSIKASDIARYIEASGGAKGLIVDLRGYPKEFVVFALGSLLVDTKTPFARFTKPDLSNPGVFTWGESLQITPSIPHYGGKVVILVDEMTQSQAEYTAMALRASPHAIVIGSTTAGADGNISNIPLPGGRRAAISGIGVFYPNKRRTQQLGIIPDIAATPTIRGIREGRDEVVERAVLEIVGR